MTNAAIELLTSQRNKAKTEAENLARDNSEVIQQGERAQARVAAAFARVEELDAAIKTLTPTAHSVEVPQ